MSRSEEETRKIAADIAGKLPDGAVIALKGGLGAGKTTFVRGMAKGLDIDPDEVSSPTFSLMNEYMGGRGRLCHFDMYRINSEEDMYFAGFYDSIDEGAFLAVEWSENVADYLPEDTVTVTLETVSQNVRRITVEGMEQL